MLPCAPGTEEQGRTSHRALGPRGQVTGVLPQLSLRKDFLSEGAPQETENEPVVSSLLPAEGHGHVTRTRRRGDVRT